MAFGSRFGGGAGGKKGPRGHNGSFKTKGVKLRPQPERPFLDASRSDIAASSSKAVKGKGKAKPVPAPVVMDGDESDGDDDEFGYVADLKSERKPLEGAIVTVTGLPKDKATLMEMARELGARSEETMTAEATHLIAEGFAKPTEKLDRAIQHGIKVMTTEWLHRVRAAWTSAEPVDFQALEIECRMLPFHALCITLTGFARGEHKNEYQTFLQSHGATVSPQLRAHTTHLVVASPLSPHSQPENTAKLVEARQRNIPIVWEGWAREVVRRRGVISDRVAYWSWEASGIEPIEAESDAVDALMDTFGEKSLGPQEQLALADDAEDPPIAVSRRVVPRATKHDLRAVDSLVGEYSGRNTSAHLATDWLPIEIPGRTTTAPDAAIPDSAAELPPPPQQPLAPAKSLIKALTSSKSASFRSSSPPRPKLSVQRTASQQDDSAFFESAEDLEVDDSPPSSKEKPIFEGLKFALMDMGGPGDAVKEAITQRGGQVSVDEGEAGADWIIVPCFGARQKYRNSGDQRVVTCIWIEHCIWDDSWSPPADRLLERPLAYEVPVTGGELLNINTSSCSEVEALHVKRFVEAHGGTYGNTFDRTRSHLVHGEADTSAKPSGPKADKARKWGVPVVGLKWLQEWGKQTAKESGEAVLAGCVVAFSSKVECDRKVLHTMLSSLGATVVVKYHAAVTHLLHTGPKSNATFKEFKARPVGLHIVHPNWVEQCSKTKKRLSEADFPLTYDPKKGGQLVGLVSSPPRRQPSVRLNTPVLSPLKSKPSRPRSVSPEAEVGHFEVAPDAAQPKAGQPYQAMQEERPRLDATSSSPPLPQANPSSETDSPAPISRLKAQTSILLAQLEAAPADAPVARRKGRISRTPSVLVDGAVDGSGGPRRVPGGDFEESQFTQMEDYRMDIVFVDPLDAGTLARVQETTGRSVPKRDAEAVLDGQPTSRRLKR